MITKNAIITGITGQDGAYLAQLLIEKDYKVYGTYRRAASTHFWRVEELGIRDNPSLHLIEYDLSDLATSIRVLEQVDPVEVYNLAAQSNGVMSFEQPIVTAQINGQGAVNLLEAIRIVNQKIRFYQASSSEMFGLVQEVPQSEKTPLCPRSPYGCAKVFAHWMTVTYWESYNIFGASGILFNHESPLRGLDFVTRKITYGLARVKLDQQSHIELGNLESKRDWGYAKDYVDGMWRMLQMDKPGSYVLATGRAESVRDFVEMTCKALDIDIAWQGSGIEEVGVNLGTGKIIVKVNPQFYRPAEVNLLIGNPAKAKAELGWEAETTLEQLCAIMVEADLRRIERG